MQLLAGDLPQPVSGTCTTFFVKVFRTHKTTGKTISAPATAGNLPAGEIENSVIFF